MKPIQKFSIALLMVLFAIITQALPVHADNDKLDFTLVNKTGYGIKGVYVSPTASTDWGDNLISKPLENGDSLAITFSEKAKAEKWDIRIEWVDEGDAVVWKGYKLPEITKITLHYDRKTDETTAETE
jgi:hypothetical protein